jgi:hypothetical protein
MHREVGLPSQRHHSQDDQQQGNHRVNLRTLEKVMKHPILSKIIGQ